ncbi:MAG: hypothetical protein HYY77_19535, partial [Betaproteobacteria bacterium]|nr:hypothetical protein [Betaproteobacteria bacterium]
MPPTESATPTTSSRLLRWVMASSGGQTARNLVSGWIGGIVTFTSVAFALLYWYFAGFGYFSPESFITLYLAFTLALIF